MEQPPELTEVPRKRRNFGKGFKVQSRVLCCGHCHTNSALSIRPQHCERHHGNHFQRKRTVVTLRVRRGSLRRQPNGLTRRIN
ncbi:hypothetical protein FA13DRAFT_1736919 [Coprinellus micaceus]|uniref:Uncharacterized protein n=1 Tax=Coprinellus micaceus TaxID=71717 RepID=A0A4Y7SZF3_COPMI|nr:hypothetical protein FA13DRAFT_1736919 [Coprinellus micaceus]